MSDESKSEASKVVSLFKGSVPPPGSTEASEASEVSTAEYSEGLVATIDWLRAEAVAGRIKAMGAVAVNEKGGVVFSVFAPTDDSLLSLALIGGVALMNKNVSEMVSERDDG